MSLDLGDVVVELLGEVCEGLLEEAILPCALIVASVGLGAGCWTALRLGWPPGSLGWPLACAGFVAGVRFDYRGHARRQASLGPLAFTALLVVIEVALVVAHVGAHGASS